MLKYQSLCKREVVSLFYTVSINTTKIILITSWNYRVGACEYVTKELDNVLVLILDRVKSYHIHAYLHHIINSKIDTITCNITAGKITGTRVHICLALTFVRLHDALTK